MQYANSIFLTDDNMSREKRSSKSRKERPLTEVLPPKRQSSSSSSVKAKIKMKEKKEEKQRVEFKEEKKERSKSAKSIPSPKSKSKMKSDWRHSAPNFKTLETEVESSSDEESGMDLNLDKVTLKVGTVTYKMDGKGDWSTSLNSMSVQEELRKLRKSNAKILAENNLLKVKNEVLLDMIAKKTLRIKQAETDLRKLEKLSRKQSRYSLDEE